MLTVKVKIHAQEGYEPILPLAIPDLKNPDSPIVQFANAFGAKPKDVVAGLHAETATSANGNMPFVALRTSDGVSLLMAQRGVNEEWTWQEATLIKKPQNRETSKLRLSSN